jgi:hypothetical protein
MTPSKPVWATGGSRATERGLCSYGIGLDMARQDGGSESQRLARVLGRSGPPWAADGEETGGAVSRLD